MQTYFRSCIYLYSAVISAFPLFYSRLTEWKKSHPSPFPRVKKLVVEQCWNNDTFLAKPEQLTLKLSPEVKWLSSNYESQNTMYF